MRPGNVARTAQAQGNAPRRCPLRPARTAYAPRGWPVVKGNSEDASVRELLGRLVDQMVAGGITFEDGRREFERRFISRVLSETDGHLSKAAEQLGLHRNTLTRKLAELELKPKKSKRR
jgi:Fis family transcriptional regulator